MKTPKTREQKRWLYACSMFVFGVSLALVVIVPFIYYLIAIR